MVKSVLALLLVVSQTVQELPSPADEGSGQPSLSAGLDGRVYLSWQVREGGSAALRFAVWDGREWSRARTIASGGDWFVNWADFPSIAVGDSGLMAAHWLAKSGDATYAYDVNISLSRDGGITWSDPIVPHRDGTQTEHGFVSFVPLEDGRMGVVWLDGRDTASGGGGHGQGAMGVRYATLDSKGRVFDQTVLDERVCECCQTDAARASSGLVAAFRNRSREEVRDIAVVAGRPGEWSEPRLAARDGWIIPGCPVNGPRLDALGERVALAWFTMPEGVPEVRIAFSQDGGRSFGESFTISSGQTPGRVDTLLLGDGSAIVALLESPEAGADPDIVLKRVAGDGKVLGEWKVAATSARRASGFPRMARANGFVYVAWRDLQGDRVRVARLSEKDLASGRKDR